jgi:hypothetical protein
VLEVTGTTVITPRPSRAAVLLAASLLTTTGGRVLLAADPRAGSRSTVTISPRRTQVPRPSAVAASWNFPWASSSGWRKAFPGARGCGRTGKSRRRFR